MISDASLKNLMALVILSTPRSQVLVHDSFVARIYLDLSCGIIGALLLSGLLDSLGAGVKWSLGGASLLCELSLSLRVLEKRSVSVREVQFLEVE